MSRRWVLFWAVLMLIAAAASSFRTVQLYAHPPSTGWIAAETWYERLCLTLALLTSAAACIAYLIRRAGQPRVPTPSRWRERTELRLILYAFATAFALMTLLAIFKTLLSIHSSPGQERSFWSTFSYFELFPSAIATLAIYYDRRSLKDEAKTDGLCPRCGYDLRATRDRCPECGMVAGRSA